MKASEDLEIKCVFAYLGRGTIRSHVGEQRVDDCSGSYSQLPFGEKNQIIHAETTYRISSLTPDIIGYVSPPTGFLFNGTHSVG